MMSRLLFRQSRRLFSTESAIALPKPNEGDRVVSGMPSAHASRRVRVYSPCHFVGQEKVHKKGWLLDYQGLPKRFQNQLMGWTSNTDTTEQTRIQMWFETAEDAATYCKTQGLEYFIEKPNEPKFKTKAYADVFKYKGPPQPAD